LPERRQGGSQTRGTEQTRVEALARLVYSDDLTGLKNRRFLGEYLRERLTGDDPKKLALVFCDIDRFKAVNDTYGHNTGDDAITLLGKCLESSVRSDDIVVRYAGDEFIVLLPDVGKEIGRHVAENIRKNVEDGLVLDVGGKRVALTISLGVAAAPVDADHPEALIEAADQALYVSKMKGRNVVSYFGETHDGRLSVQELLKGFPCPRSIGRAEALKRCQKAALNGAPGAANLTFLTGDGGCGKTRLLAELSRGRAALGQQPIFATCRQELQPLPFAPLCEALRAELTMRPSLSGVIESVLDDKHRRLLALKIPELAREGEAPAELVGPEAREALFAAWIQVLRGLASNRSAFLVLDDIQYADSATISLLWFLSSPKAELEEGANLPVFAAVASDTPESVAGTFSDFYQRVGARDSVEFIEIRRLTTDGVADMIDACFEGNRFPVDFAAKIDGLAHGNPLFVEEVLIILVLSDVIVHSPDGWRLKQAQVALPSTLNRLLMAHLEQLDHETANLLTQASVLGTRFSVDLVCRVLDMNQGRVTQMLEKGVAYRLLAGNLPGAPDTYRFVNRRLQELVYEVVDDDQKRTVHARTASLKEHVVVDDFDDALAEIRWHQQRAGRPSRANHARLAATMGKLFAAEELEAYFQVAGELDAPRVEARIPEATTPIKSRQLPIVQAFLKALVTADRGVRMYPPGSTYTLNAINDCLSSVTELLASIEGITLKEREGKLELNGRFFERAQLGHAGDLVLQVLQDARIHSLTFNRRVQAGDIEALAAGFRRFADPEQPPDWSEHLAASDTRGIGIIAKEYRALATDAASVSVARAIEGLAREPVLASDLPSHVLRYTAGVIEAVRLYPEGSETVSKAMAGLMKALELVHNIVPTVTISLTETGLLVNDVRLESRASSFGFEAVQDMLKAKRIGSLSIHRGIEPPEIEAFLRHEGAIPDDPRQRRAMGLRHIAINEFFFVAADAQGGAGADEAAPAEVVKLHRDVFLRRILEGGPTELLGDQLRQELPGFVSDLMLDDEREQVGQVVDKLFENLNASEPEHRLAALNVAAELVNGTSAALGEELLRQSARQTTQAIRNERAPNVLARVVELAEQTTRALLRAGDTPNAARAIWALGRELQADTRVESELAAEASAVISRLIHTPEFNRGLAPLWSPDSDKRAAAMHLLEACGEPITERLLELMTTAQSEGERHQFAQQLARVGEPRAVAHAVRGWLSANKPSEEILPMLRILDTINPEPVGELLRVVSHPDDRVQSEIADLLRRIDGRVAQRFLTSVLELPNPTLQSRGIELVARVKPPDAPNMLLRIVEDDAAELAMRVEACHALGRLRDPRAIHPLTLLVKASAWGRISRRAAPSEVQQAAIWALSSFATEEATAAVHSASQHHSKQVKAAALSALEARKRSGSRAALTTHDMKPVTSDE